MKRFKYVLFLTFMLLTSCIEESTTIEYMQFNSFELGFLYYPYDTLTYIGNSIEHKDSMFYKTNNKDTSIARVKTIIQDWEKPMSFNNKNTVSGKSTLSLDKPCGINFLSISMTKEFEGFFAGLCFQLNINNRGYYYLNDRIDTIKPIHLQIQGFNYDSVYVFNIYKAGPSYDYLQINYARKYGFISIKVNDSIRVERLVR